MIEKMAKTVYNFLLKSKTKDVMLLIRSDKFTVMEYEDEPEGDFKKWSTLAINFDYSNKELPTLEQIEDFIYKVFKKKLK